MLGVSDNCLKTAHGFKQRYSLLAARGAAKEPPSRPYVRGAGGPPEGQACVRACVRAWVRACRQGEKSGKVGTEPIPMGTGVQETLDIHARLLTLSTWISLSTHDFCSARTGTRENAGS